MELDPLTVKQFAESVKDLDGTLSQLREIIHPKASDTSNGSSNLNFIVQGMNGKGLKIVSGLAFAMFCMFISMTGAGIWVITEMSMSQMHAEQNIVKMDQKIDRQQDYLNIILQWAPELKKKMNQDKKDKPQ